MPLEPEELKHLEAAQGYCGLGMYLDADDEIERIDAYARAVPEVLGVRVEIYRNLEKWEQMQAVAKTLAVNMDGEPHWWVCWAFATRRAECLDKARDILILALEQYPRAAVVHYNLACYECQLGDLGAAKRHLEVAFSQEPECRLTALEEADFQPLWLGSKDIT